MRLQQLLPRRLDRQVMLLVILLLLLVMPIFALYEAGKSAEREVDSAKLQARALAENISVTSVAHIVIHDFSSTEQLLLRSARFPGVLEIQVTDINGRVMGDVYTDSSKEPTLRYDIQQLSLPQASHSQVQEQSGRLIIWEPIMAARQVGWVRLTYSLADAKIIARRHLYDYLIEGFVMTLLLVALILLVMQRPLRVLRDAATFAGELTGKSGAQIPVDNRSIEIEQLGKALNMASTNLFEQETMIKKTLNALRTQKAAMDEHSIVSITDVDGKITYANQKLLDVTGLSSEELLGKKYSIINSGYHDEIFFQGLWNTVSSGQVWHGEILNRGKRSRGIWMSTTIVPFMDELGRPYEYVAISTDITGRKKIELELEQKANSLKQMTDHLEELVKLRTSELEEANRQLQHLNKIKSEFVSIVSHELRTPLTSIKSFAEILKEDGEEIDIDTQKRFLSIINDESDRLGRLINDLLDLQKMESGKMLWKDEQVNLVDVLKRSVDFFSQAFSDKGLQLTLELTAQECFVDLDADRMRQLITNLLSNALKFTELGGVTIVMHVDPGDVRVMVADTGMGIPEAEIEKVFDSFHQVDSSKRRKIGGTGLGLAICKEIVEHYGGRIWAESKLGEGSCFNFTLPLAGRERGVDDEQ